MFEKAQGWTKMGCRNRIFGFTSLDARGTLEVLCTATKCQKVGHRTFHQFDLRSGVCVTEYVPVTAPTPLRRDAQTA